MKVVMLKINNFRGIKSAELYFEGHTLLVGTNNVGKSTICEALDLALSPDRLKRFPVVDEFDFYNGKYKDEEGKPILIEIEVVLLDLTADLTRRCKEHLDYWDVNEKRTLEEGECDKTVERNECLHLKMVAQYDSKEDEFIAETYFVKNLTEELTIVNREIKRQFGFLYLRASRTGNRALTLGRGSLLDVIFRAMDIKEDLWEGTRNKLFDFRFEECSSQLQSVMGLIEKKLEDYIPLGNASEKMRLCVSKLTREHLRETLSFFITTSDEQLPVPFERVGAGTLSALVLALLSYIGDLKGNIIFAMEEPEIALAPYTQRKIVKYLLEKSSQCFVTSHSPYVIERFQRDQIHILNRNRDIPGQLETVRLVDSTIKDKKYKQHLRKSFAEAILSRGVIVGEGLTEVRVLQTVSEMLEQEDGGIFPLDVAGICILSSDGAGDLLKFGQFFKSLGIPVYGFFDYDKKRSASEREELKAVYDITCETEYDGMEVLLSEEVPLDIQRIYLKDSSETHNLDNSDYLFDDNSLRNEVKKILKNNKGEEFSANLLRCCSIKDLPKTITDFLYKIYRRSNAILQQDNIQEKNLKTGSKTITNDLLADMEIPW